MKRVLSTFGTNWPQKGPAISAGPFVLLDHFTLESDVSVKGHRTVRAGVRPSLAERTRRNSSGISTVDVPAIDVQSRHTQELVVKNVESIGAKLQAEALIEFKVLSHCQIQLVAGHGTEGVATHRTGERISAAERINRKRVVYDEVHI